MKYIHKLNADIRRSFGKLSTKNRGVSKKSLKCVKLVCEGPLWELLYLVCTLKKRQITQKKVKTDNKCVLYKKIVLLVSSRKINVYPKGASINDVRI